MVNTVSVNGMFRRKTTMLKNANGMIRYMTLGFLRARVTKRNANRGPPHDARSLELNQTEIGPSASEGARSASEVRDC